MATLRLSLLCACVCVLAAMASSRAANGTTTSSRRVGWDGEVGVDVLGGTLVGGELEGTRHALSSGYSFPLISGYWKTQRLSTVICLNQC